MGEECNYGLFINKHGELVYAECAFKVICLRDTHILRQGDIVAVSSVIYTDRDIIIYVVAEELYYHYHFDLYPHQYNAYSM